MAVCLRRVEGLGSNRKTGFKFPVLGDLFRRRTFYVIFVHLQQIYYLSWWMEKLKLKQISIS